MDGSTVIFSSGAGNVMVVDDESAITFSLLVDEEEDTFNNLKAIMTSVGIQAQGGFQFMHAMREFIYVYVFTERVGEIVINGLAFPSSCTALGPQDTSGSEPTGLERILTWYENNRITTRAAPIVITIGDLTYNSFLTAMKADIANAETGIAQFSMHFNFIPNLVYSDDFCFSIDESCSPNPCT